MDNDISHAQKAVNDDVEARLNAIEAHLGLVDEEENEDPEDEDTEADE